MKKYWFLASLGLLFSCKETQQSIYSKIENFGAVPSQRQLEWHKMEYYAFIHFNMNTFTDMEWGMGSEKPERFNPTELNAEQWVEVIKNAGMKGVILTAKHHDGFCLWPSKYTEHSVKNSPWREGKGDVVKELSQACKKHGIKFGVYLSPWDRNHPEYAREAYVAYFHNQLRELLTNYGEIFEVWFDGANGGDGYYGGANEVRKIDAKTYYQWDKVREIVRELQPNAVIFGDNDDVRWVGNEEGVGGEVSWATINMDKIPEGLSQNEHLSMGDAGGKAWIPAEVDVSVRPGWYYHQREDHQVKSLEHLTQIYYNSVGRNASLLLNFPVDTRGLIHEKDAEQVLKLKKVIDEDFKTELAFGSNIEASSEFHEHTSAKKAIDQSEDTFWKPQKQDKEPVLLISFKEEKEFNRVVAQEFIAKGQRISKYKIQANIRGIWQDIYSGQTIGYKTIMKFNPVKASQVRLIVEESLATPLLSNIEVYNAPKLLTQPRFSRNKKGEVSLISADKNLDIFFTTNGENPTKNSQKYENPFLVETRQPIKAICYDKDANKYSEILDFWVDIPKENWKIHEISSGDLQKAEALIDEKATEFYTQNTGKTQFVTIDLGEEISLEGFSYLPPQSRWAYGTITKYEFFVSKDAKNWKKVSQGEFQNVKNNPILQEKYFDKQKARYIKLVSKDQTDNSLASGFAEISVITSKLEN